MYDRHDLFAPPSSDAHAGEARHNPNEPADYWSVPAGRKPQDTLEQDVFTPPDLQILDGQWDTEAELAKLLHPRPATSSGPVSAMQPTSQTHGQTHPAVGPPPAGGQHPPPVHPAEHEEPASAGTGFAPPTTSRPVIAHRHRRIRTPRLTARRTVSLVVAGLTAAIVAAVSVLCGMVSYAPLRSLAEPEGTEGLARWWPLLVYGPWMVASLSILRTALHRRSGVHSWTVVLLFSAVAVLLCVAHGPKTVTGAVVAGLPPIAAVTCFHQLVRQITLTHPPKHAFFRRRGRGRASH